MAEPIRVTTTYADQANKPSSNTLYVKDGLTEIQMLLGLQIFAPIVDAVVDGVIRSIDYTLDIDLSTLTGNTATQTSDVEEIGEYISRTAQGRDVILNVPATNDTASPAGSDNIDPTDPLIAPLISMLEDGLAVTLGTIIPSDVDGNDIVEVVTSRERVRNSGSRG